MPRVLVVDDDPEVRSALARFVTRHGHEVSQAASAAKGVAAIRRSVPDLVITDMEMPGGNGFLVLQAGNRSHVPVVILTGHASVEVAVEAMKGGAANVLSKPFSSDTVAQVLQEAFGARSITRSPEAPAPPSAPHDHGPPVPAGEDESFRAVRGIVERVASVELPSSGVDLGEALRRVEGVLIEQALERSRGNRTQAAALLRINRTTLVEKLRRLDGAAGGPGD